MCVLILDESTGSNAPSASTPSGRRPFPPPPPLQYDITVYTFVTVLYLHIICPYFCHFNDLFISFVHIIEFAWRLLSLLSAPQNP